MELIGSVVVFLLGAGVGLLVGIYLAISRFTRDAKKHLASAQERAEQRAGERRAHLDATTAIVMERMRLVGAALAAQLRETAAEQRNDLRLAVGLPAVEMPGRRPPRRAASTESTALRSSPAASSRTLGDDEPTPPSGWTPEELGS